ncbi:MAG TPA: dTMP kinase [Phycisphaerales bacterium]|nr:dTMP kinase [Phycisphaerales bacterium]
MDGVFITLEGLEGAGKSTQAKILADNLTEAGYPVTLVREPGGTAVGEAIRGILADPQYDDMSPLTEVFLFAASRTQLVEQVIRPKLGEGTIVICDRYFDATLAYQGYGRGVHPTQIREIGDICSWGVRPDVTFLLDIEPARGLNRVRTRSVETLTKLDRFETLDLGFFEKVREGYLEIAQEEPFRFRVVDATGEKDPLAQRIFELSMDVVKKKLPDPGRLSLGRRGLE